MMWWQDAQSPSLDASSLQTNRRRGDAQQANCAGPTRPVRPEPSKIGLRADQHPIQRPSEPRESHNKLPQVCKPCASPASKTVKKDKPRRLVQSHQAEISRMLSTIDALEEMVLERDADNQQLREELLEKQQVQLSQDAAAELARNSSPSSRTPYCIGAATLANGYQVAQTGCRQQNP
jgi:hypothetical protein